MIKNHAIYHPLYQDRDHFVIIVTGGRGSGKSFSVATFIERLTFELKKRGLSSGEEEKIVHNVLYSRYTMASASMSVIPEFMEKVELDGTQAYFHATKTDIINKLTGAKIMFRGIKTSSGNQTAKLKSIHGITTFVCDEAEEYSADLFFDSYNEGSSRKRLRSKKPRIFDASLRWLTITRFALYQKPLNILLPQWN